MTGCTMIWCANRRKYDYRISLLRFLTLSYICFAKISIVNWKVSVGLLNFGVEKWMHWVLFKFFFGPLSLYQSFIGFPPVAACVFNCSRRCATEQGLSVVCADESSSFNSWNEFVLMSLVKILKRIGPSIDPWSTPNALEFGFDLILSIFTECVVSLK